MFVRGIYRKREKALGAYDIVRNSRFPNSVYPKRIAFMGKHLIQRSAIVIDNLGFDDLLSRLRSVPSARTSHSTAEALLFEKPVSSVRPSGLH